MIQEIENFKNNIKKGLATFFKFKTVQCLSKIVQIQKDRSKSWGYHKRYRVFQKNGRETKPL